MSQFVGQVKWFNKRGGYGFITCLTDGEHKSEDIFVYHDDIVTTADCFRFLVQGETVQFELGDSQNSEHKYQAKNVSGVSGADLACERPRPQRRPRTERPRRETSSREQHRRKPTTRGPPRTKQVLTGEDGSQWVLVRK